MKKLFLALAGIGLMTSGAFAQTATLSFNDFGGGGGFANSGSYAPGASFSFDIFLTTTGQIAGDTTTGLSYWFETSGIAATNGYFTLTTRNFTDTLNGGAAGTSPFNTAIQNPNGDVIPASPGNANDMGGTVGVNPGQPPNLTYFVATLTFSISATAAPGTYAITTTTLSPHVSEATNHRGTVFSDMNLSPTTYTIVVIPEPATWSLIGLGALGLVGVNLLRARK